jgi:hypothetical protein
MSLAQSRYPLQTVFKGENVVILTKKQADDINTIFERQKWQIAELEREIQKMSYLSDSIVSQYESRSQYYDSLLDRLVFFNQYMHKLAKDGAWIYYSYADTSIKVMDLSYYNVRLDKETGDLLFMNMPYEFRVDPVFMTQRQQEQENPPIDWERRIGKAIRPKVFTFPK